MTLEQDAQLESLFHAALELEPAARGAFARQACGADAELGRALERLLRHHEQAGDFINAPVWPPFEAAAVRLAAPPKHLASGQQLGHFRIQSLLGQGGMGEVYLAEDLRLERKVALKLLPAEFITDAERVSRFEREAKAASALNHPNILTIYEINRIEQSHFIATEFIEGHTLREHMESACLSPPVALDIAVQIASALSVAHAAGIVHRDLKPENVMVRPDGLVKILDFGLAKLTEGQRDRATERQKDGKTEGRGDDGLNLPLSLCPSVSRSLRLSVSLSPGLTEPGAVMGTVSYMSPEQARGQEVDARTDIFSFGVVLYEIFAGQLPFTGASANDVIAEILKTEPLPLRQFAPDAPRELERIVSQALEKDPAHRYSGSAQLLAELKALRQQLDSGALAVRRASSVKYLFGRLKRHRRVAIGLLATLLLAALALFFHARRTTLLTERDTLLLADFANTTGDTVFDDALAEALAVQLAQTPFLNLLPIERVRETLQLMQRPPGSRLTRELAREICVRQGLRAWIGGSIAQFGQRYAIRLEAVDARSGEALASTLREAESKDRILSSLGEAASEMRAQLGESLASRRQFNQPLEKATTASLEALEAYSLGMAQGRQGQSFEAIAHYLRAIRLDPDFAAAHVQLSIAYNNTRQFQLGIQHADKAYQLRERASHRERLNIELSYHSQVKRDLEKRFEIISLLAQTYPREASPHGMLSAFYNNRGQIERALAESREAVRLSGGEVTSFYIPLATALIRLNRFDEAKEELRRTQARKLAGTGFAHRLYQVGFVQGDAALMEEQLASLRGKPDEYQALEWQALTADFTGRQRAAWDFEQRAMALASQRNLTGAAAAMALEAALRRVMLGAEPQIKDAVALAPPGPLRNGRDDALLPVEPLALALGGELHLAQLMADEIARDNPNNTLMQAVGLPLVRAALALKNNRPDQAAELLEPARPYEAAAAFWPNYLRAQAYLDARRGAEAAAEFQKIIDHRGWDPTSALWPLAHLGLARAAALNGDAPLAERSYRAFFDLWRDADADLPLLVAARREHPSR